MTGPSAGGAITFWLACHDDLADKDNKDPVLRESSRIQCAVPVRTPVIFDPELYVKEIGGSSDIHKSFPLMFDVKKTDDLKTDSKAREVMLEAPALTHIRKDDPPVLLVYTTPPEKKHFPPSAQSTKTIHSARHGLYAEKFMKSKGIEVELSSPDKNKKVIEFIEKSFKKQTKK